MATSSEYGAYVPTTQIWDVAQINQTDVNSPEFKELLVRMYQQINLIANVLNVKETALYPLGESINNQMWFPNPLYNSSTAIAPSERNDYRSVYNLPVSLGIALPTGVTTIAHGITVTPVTTFTKIYGVANQQSSNDYYPLPWASAAGATNIEIRVDATDIVITNNSGINFTNCYVIVEYLQN